MYVLKALEEMYPEFVFAVFTLHADSCCDGYTSRWGFHKRMKMYIDNDLVPLNNVNFNFKYKLWYRGS